MVGLQVDYLFIYLHVFLIFRQQAYMSYEIRYKSHKKKVNVVQNLSALSSRTSKAVHINWEQSFKYL